MEWGHLVLSLCRLEAPKWILLQIVKAQMKCCILRHFIRDCTVCCDKIDYQSKKYIFFLILTCDPQIYTMDHTDLTISDFKGESIGLQRVNVLM